MRIKETKVYQYSELSDKAKERAREWLRTAGAHRDGWSDYMTEDFHETLKALGFDVDRVYGVQWSGFWSQGDGASFSGTWRASDCDPVALLEDRPATVLPAFLNAPGAQPEPSKENVELHRIAGELLECKKAGMSHACIDASRRGFYMSLNGTGWDDQPDTATADEWADHCTVTEARFIEASRDLARAFYKALEAEYDYQNSDEQIAENIEANGYEFTEDGERA
jgi:hypothetical protein